MARPTLPNDAIYLDELIKLWPECVPPLRDQGEADRINQTLGTLLDKLVNKGKVIPAPVFVTDEPPTGDRAALLGDSQQEIKTTWFGMAVARFYKHPLFRRFWNTLSKDEQAAMFTEVSR